MADFAFHWLDPRSARTRLLWAGSLGLVAWLLIPERLPLATRVLATWDAIALVLLGVVGWIITQSGSSETARRAAAIDPGRRAVWFIVLGASVFSIFGATIVVHQANQLSTVGDDLLCALCVATVVISWLLTHAAFTLRYAHLHYRVGPDDPEGGIDFPGGEKPDDLDFAYFAFTIGMCFQVSDATISRRSVRHTALGHAMLSFAYNTVIIALALNLLMGHLGS